MGKMQSRRSICFAIVLGAGALLLAASVRAAPINYGNFNGTNVMFLGVTEDSSTDPPPLFGPPTPSNDSLSFNPVSFGASATGGGATSVDITDGTLKSTLMTSGIKRIHKVTWNESGDYTIAGGVGTTATGVSVGAAVFLQVIELDGVGVAPINLNGNLLFTPSGGTYDFVNDPHGPASPWSGTLTMDIDALLAAQSPPIVGQATKILLTMDNTLVATSENGTAATIKKKTSNGVTIIVDTDVPEPASMALVALGGVALLVRRKA